MKVKHWLTLLLKSYVSIALFALLILPYASSLDFTGIEDYATWADLFIWEDEIILLMYVPFFVLWPCYLVAKRKWQLTCLLFLTFCYMGNNAGLLFLPIPDFVPGPGLVLATTFFPPVLLLYLLTRKKNTAVEHK